jgi:hypothetical protein
MLPFSERPRSLQIHEIKEARVEETHVSILTTGGTGWSNPRNPGTEVLKAGDIIELETINYSMTTGLRLAGSTEWLWWKSDEDLQRQHEEYVAKSELRKRKFLEDNQEAWAAEEAALPAWVASRIAVFHEKGGEDFKLDGWGYELIIARLAVLYADMGEEIMDKTISTITDSEEIKKISHEEGTSGNQHSMALALAKAHLRDEELAGTVSALSPISGDPFYEKGN